MSNILNNDFGANEPSKIEKTNLKIVIQPTNSLFPLNKLASKDNSGAWKIKLLIIFNAIKIYCKQSLQNETKSNQESNNKLKLIVFWKNDQVKTRKWHQQ